MAGRGSLLLRVLQPSWLVSPPYFSFLPFHSEFLSHVLITYEAIMAYFVMHDFPSTAKFLTTSEKGEVIRRLEQDQSVLSEEFKWQFVIDALKDWKIHIQMVIFFGIFTSVYSVSIFLPTIIKGLGYTNEIAQLLSAPPYIVACICTLLTGYWSDKNGRRGGYIMVACTIA